MGSMLFVKIWEAGMLWALTIWAVNSRPHSNHRPLRWGLLLLVLFMGTVCLGNVGVTYRLMLAGFAT